MNEILKIFVLVRIFQENFGILGISGILRGTSTLFIFQQFSCLKKLSFYFLISFLSNSGKMGLNFSGKFLGKNLTSNSSQIFFQQLDCTRCGKTWVTVKYVKYILFLSCTTLYCITQSFSKQMSWKNEKIGKNSYCSYILCSIFSQVEMFLVFIKIDFETTISSWWKTSVVT